MLDGAFHAGERRWFLTCCQIKQGRAVSSRAGDVGVRPEWCRGHVRIPQLPLGGRSLKHRAKITLRR